MLGYLQVPHAPVAVLADAYRRVAGDPPEIVRVVVPESVMVRQLRRTVVRFGAFFVGVSEECLGRECQTDLAVGGERPF